MTGEDKGWEWRGGLLEEVSWFETSPVVIGIEKPAVKCEWKRKVRANLSWSVLRLLKTGAKPLALLSAGGPRSRPTQGSQARPRRLFQCTAMAGQDAPSRRKGGYFTLDGEVKGGALWVLRLAVGDGWTGEGSYCTWAVQNVERTYLKKYLFEHWFTM